MMKRVLTGFVVALLIRGATLPNARAVELAVPAGYPTIQDAIDAASDGDTVSVSPGHYEGPLDFGGKIIRIVSTDGSGSTRISSETGSVVVFRNSESRGAELRGFTIWAGSGTRIGSHTYGGGILLDRASPTISDCTVRGNRATFGGGLACLNGASPRITGCRISTNAAARDGGGLYAENTDGLEIDDCDFGGNRAESDGGGAFLINARTATLSHSRVRWNRSVQGAGVSCRASFLSVRDSAIERNHATRGGGGIHVEASALVFERNRVSGNHAARSGGGIRCDGNTSAILAENHWLGNRLRIVTALGLPPQGGAAVALIGCREVRLERNRMIANRVVVEQGRAYGGAVFCYESTEVSLSGNTLLRNGSLGSDGSSGSGGSGAGGAIAIFRSETTLAREKIRGNHADERGGGVHSIDSRIRLDACDLRRNSTHGAGGAIAAEKSRFIVVNSVLFGNTAEAEAGGVAFRASECDITNTTIARNETAGPGGALTLDGGSARLTNTIVWGNALGATFGPEIEARNAHVDARACLIGGGWAGEGNFDAEPRFVHTRRGDVRLRFDSPCVDAGIDDAPFATEFDIEGDPRVIDGDLDAVARTDIGADELRPEIAARFGTVADATPDLGTPLRINGEVGNAERVVRLPIRQAIAVDMMAQGPGTPTANFALYAFLDRPDPTTVRLHPFGLGLATFATPLSGLDPANPPLAIWNNLGYRTRLGTPTHGSTAAPSRVIHFARGVSSPICVTLQGIIVDNASRATIPASLTNAIVLEIVSGPSVR